MVQNFFSHFLDIAVVNSYLIHKDLLKHNPTKKPLSHKKYREELTREMVAFAEDSAAAAAAGPPPRNTCMPAFFEDGARRYCKRCHGGNPRVKTIAYCSKSSVPLCLSAKKSCGTMESKM